MLVKPYIGSEIRMIIMRGVSGSGKSTIAEKIKNEDPDKWAIVSRDTLRAELMGKDNLERYFENGMNIGVEQEINVMEQDAIARALALGKNVVVDNTNLRPKYIIGYIKIAADFGISHDKIMFYECTTPTLEEAYARVQGRGERLVSKKIIQQQIDTLRSFSTEMLWDTFVRPIMADYRPKKWYLPPFEVERYVPDPSQKRAIICDLDGTLAHRALLTEPYVHYRSFYEYGKCNTDIVDPLVADVLVGLYFHGYQIIFVSGRKNDCYQETVDFIKRAIGLDRGQYTLLMRDPEIDIHEEHGEILDDHDDNVKYRLFNENLRENTNIVGVIDDRKRVVALWEALGIRVMNVGLLNEEF